MKRGHAAGLSSLLALAAVAVLAVYFLREEPAPAPDPPRAEPAAPQPPPPRAPELAPPPAVPGPSPPPPAGEKTEAAAPGEPSGGRRGGARSVLGELKDDEEDEDWKAYPSGARGPVVVGVVVKYGEDNPECSIALESVDDPKREDPSELEDLPDGRFRLVGFPPGKYRVRAKADETVAAYSNVLLTVDGAVSDAGVIRLRRPGCIAGVVQDVEGAYASAEVRLFGRHPENLGPMVVEKGKAIGRQGFQLLPHDTGEFRLAFDGEAGWAVLAGKTDPDGLSWSVVKLKPWSSLEAVFAASKGSGDAADAILRTTVEPVEVPDLGAPGRVVSVEGGGPVGRLAAGRHRVTVAWRSGAGAQAKERSWSNVVDVAEGAAAKVEVPR